MTRINSSPQTLKNHERESSIEGFTKSDVTILACTTDLVGSVEDFLNLFRSKVVSLDVSDIVFIPVKPGNDHIQIVANCIYETLPNIIFRLRPPLITVQHMHHSQPLHFCRRQRPDRYVENLATQVRRYGTENTARRF